MAWRVGGFLDEVILREITECERDSRRDGDALVVCNLRTTVSQWCIRRECVYVPGALVDVKHH